MAAAVGPGLPPRRSLRGVLIASAGCFLALALAVGFMPSLPGDTAVREALLVLASPPVLGDAPDQPGRELATAPARLAPVAPGLPARARAVVRLGGADDRRAGHGRHLEDHHRAAATRGGVDGVPEW